MRRLHQMICLLLALAWVPLTQHCELEAVGLMAGECATACEDDHSCAQDACDQFENGTYKPSSGTVKVSAPILLAFCAATLLPPPATSLVEEPPARPLVNCSLDWVPCWQFVRRTAPPSRAPALI